jgi:hypothetical protein
MLVSAQQPDPSQLKLTEAKLQAQISKNKDDSFQRLLETKRKLRTEEDPVVVKLLKKYEKKLTNELDLSSDEDDNSL